MEKNGIRVQKSVFDCLITENSFIQLKLKLEKLIDFDTDSLRYYQLCGRCISSIQHAGYAGKILDEEEEMVA